MTWSLDEARRNQEALERVDLPFLVSRRGAEEPQAYHVATCPRARMMGLGFATADEAETAGHRPCKMCEPHCLERPLAGLRGRRVMGTG